MKNPIFSLAFILIIILSSSNCGFTQNLTSLFKFEIFGETGESSQKQDFSVIVIEEDKKSEIGKEREPKLIKTEKAEVQPSSSRISIGIGKALFEKYIK